MSRPALRLVVDHEPSGATSRAPVAGDAVPPTSPVHDAQGWGNLPSAQPCAVNYYLSWSDIFHVGDVVCTACILATTIYFGLHVEQAISHGYGVWAIFGAGSL